MPDRTSSAPALRPCPSPAAVRIQQLHANSAAGGIARGFPGLRVERDGPDLRFTGAIPAERRAADSAA